MNAKTILIALLLPPVAVQGQTIFDFFFNPFGYLVDVLINEEAVCDTLISQYSETNIAGCSCSIDLERDGLFLYQIGASMQCTTNVELSVTAISLDKRYFWEPFLQGIGIYDPFLYSASAIVEGVLGAPAGSLEVAGIVSLLSDTPGFQEITEASGSILGSPCTLVDGELQCGSNCVDPLTFELTLDCT